MLLKKNLVSVDVDVPLFADSVVMTHCRMFAVLFPCLLIPVAAFGGNEATEHFNSSPMKQERALDVGINVGPVVGSMMTSNVDEGQRRREGSAERCAGCATFFDVSEFKCESVLLSDQVQSESVGHESTKQGTERSRKQFIGHGGYVSWSVLFFLGGLLGGSELMLLALRRKWISDA